VLIHYDFTYMDGRKLRHLSKIPFHHLYTQDEQIDVFDHDWKSLADGVAIPHRPANRTTQKASLLLLIHKTSGGSLYSIQYHPGTELFLQAATHQLSSPQMRFTSQFEMDECGSTPP
jgi:hypothetical protein